MCSIGHIAGIQLKESALPFCLLSLREIRLGVRVTLGSYQGLAV